MGVGALRFLLSLMVIDTHYGFFASRMQVEAVNRFGVERLAFVGPGGVAVSGFFVISGYLIALVLCRKYEAGWRGANAFYVSRALRIYPLYWLVFAAYAVALTAVDTAPSFSARGWLDNLSLVPAGVVGMAADQNVSGLSASSNPLLIGPAWTLCYDLLFYLLAPWILLRTRTCWWVAALGLLYFAAFLAWADARTPVWYQFFYGTGMPYLFMFVCGALAYHHRGRLRFRWTAALPLLAGLAWVTYFPLGMTNMYANSLTAVLLFTPLVGMLGQTATTRRTDRVLGDLTYATYLLHLPLLVLAQRLAVPDAAIWSFVATYVLSIALLVTFEYPLDRLRDRLYVRSAQRLAGAPGPERSAIGSIAVFAVLAAAAGVSVLNNVFRAGNPVPIDASACPPAWHCDRARAVFAGAGEVSFQPALGPANRIVVDVALPADSGAAWAGLQSDDGRFAAGVERAGDECHLVIANGAPVRSDPPGWSTHCRTHRFVVSRSADHVVVAVDSLWLQPPVPAPQQVRAVVRAQEGSRGTVRFDNLFVTRR